MSLPTQIMKDSTENTIKRVVRECVQEEMAVRTAELDEEKEKLAKRMDE